MASSQSQGWTTVTYRIGLRKKPLPTLTQAMACLVAFGEVHGLRAVCAGHKFSHALTSSPESTLHAYLCETMRRTLSTSICSGASGPVDCILHFFRIIYTILTLGVPTRPFQNHRRTDSRLRCSAALSARFGARLLILHATHARPDNRSERDRGQATSRRCRRRVRPHGGGDQDLGLDGRQVSLTARVSTLKS